VELVTVATPNDSHLELVVKALEAGKHVVCEKPVALSVEDFDTMCAAAARSGKRFTVHQNRRWDVDFLAIRSIIQSGEIGETINVESRVHGSRGIPSDWRCHKPYGGGMVLDWGVHLIDQMLQLIPEPITKLYCELTNITTDEVDDGFHLQLTFASGKRATVEVGTYNFVYMPRFYLQCRGGAARIEDWQVPCRVAKLKAWNEKEVIPVQTAAGITKTMAPRDEITLDTYEIPRPTSDVHDFYRNFTRAIDGLEEQRILLPEVRRVLRVMEGCFRSGETGETIKYPEGL
jgi:predicted dehydrogenase